MGNSWRRSVWRRCLRCLCGGRWRRIWHGRSWQGGTSLANQLRREYGVSLLLSPTRQQMEEADVLVLFAARTDLRRRDPAVLRLYDEAAPLPPLLLPPVLEGQMPPGLCRPQLLAVLVESGVLRPGQITVGTAES